MPNYGMFHDKRYFTSLRDLAKELGVGLPDVLKAFDMPINGTNTRVDHDYLEKPVDILREDGAEVMVNLSSSPFGIGKAPVRDAYLRRHSKGFKQFWYVNNVGRGGNGKNEHVFDGSSLMFEDGVKKVQAPTFQE
jgi:NAD+ synthase (glutamine-hydrolysing)